MDGNWCKVEIYGHGFVSLNVDGVSIGLDQVNTMGILVLESHLYPFT